MILCQGSEATSHALASHLLLLAGSNVVLGAAKGCHICLCNINQIVPQHLDVHRTVGL